MACRGGERLPRRRRSSPLGQPGVAEAQRVDLRRDLANSAEVEKSDPAGCDRHRVKPAVEGYVFDQGTFVQERPEGLGRQGRRGSVETTAGRMAGAISDAVFERGLSPKVALGRLALERSLFHRHGGVAKLFEQLLELAIGRRAYGLEMESAGPPPFRPLQYPFRASLGKGDLTAEGGDLFGAAGGVDSQLGRTKDGVMLVQYPQAGPKGRLAARLVSGRQAQQGFGMPGVRSNLGRTAPSAPGDTAQLLDGGCTFDRVDRLGALERPGRPGQPELEGGKHPSGGFEPVCDVGQSDYRREAPAEPGPGDDVVGQGAPAAPSLPLKGAARLPGRLGGLTRLTGQQECPCLHQAGFGEVEGRAALLFQRGDGLRCGREPFGGQTDRQQRLGPVRQHGCL